jgi:hypothetical protein
LICTPMVDKIVFFIFSLPYGNLNYPFMAQAVALRAWKRKAVAHGCLKL